MEVVLYVSVWGCVGFKLENPGVGFCVSLSLSLSLSSFARVAKGRHVVKGRGAGKVTHTLPTDIDRGAMLGGGAHWPRGGS